MQTVEEILAEAKHLTEGERRRKNAMNRWLARAGSGHADSTDISSNKNQYLAEISATKP